MILQERWFVRLVLSFSLFAAGLPAHAAPEPTRRSWPIGQFTSVDLVAREPDALDNQHPADWSPELLRKQLGAVRTNTVDGPAALFSADELDALVVPLSQALALAKPKDDVLLLSTSRRGGAFFIAPSGVTARLFVQDGNLQLIVHDSRLDFYNTYIGSRIEPTFRFGSRSKAGSPVLQSPAATSRRGDWLAISPTAAPVALPVVPATAPVAVPAPEVAKPSPPAAPAPVPALRPRDPGFAEDVEQRLLTLKRLFDRGLINEAEYQQKRKEVLQLL